MSNEVQGTWLNAPTRAVYYGAGSLQRHLVEAIGAVTGAGPGGPHRVLIVTGSSLATKTPVIGTVEALLHAQGYKTDVFARIGQHAPIKDILEAVEFVKANGVDVLLAIGGGSPIDAAKVISFKHQQASQANDAAAAFLPIIAVPTTLSAAEFTMTAGHTSSEGQKIGVMHAELTPKAVILDANVTLHTPMPLWLSSGVRALDHAIEAAYRPGVQPPLLTLCHGAARELIEGLPQCKRAPDNVAVRTRLQLAAWQSLWPSLVPIVLGLSHAVGHVLGATYAIPHGICSCLSLAPSMRLLARSLPPTSKERLQLHHLARVVTNGAGDLDALADVVQALVVTLQLDTTLAAYDVPKQHHPRLANDARQKLVACKYADVPSADDIVEHIFATL